jgi:DUF1009 family protein
MPPKLGIIAGGGPLPQRLIDHCSATGREVFVVALDGHVEPSMMAQDNVVAIRPGAAGRILSVLNQEKVEELVIVGAVKRPSMLTVLPDWGGIKFLCRVGWRAFRGDDQLLKAIAQEIERVGFKVIGVHEVLPELLAPVGIIGSIEANADRSADIELGIRAAKNLGVQDLGQAVVVADGKVMAEEGKRGTNALLSHASYNTASKPILVKMCKPQQDRRLDMPTVGENTVKLAAEAGFAGIVVEADKTLMADREAAVATANAAGLFILGVETDHV